MRGDLKVIGQAPTVRRRIAASATRVEYGEPTIQASATLSSGAASANVFTLAATDIGVIGTDNFGGVAIKGTRPWKTGTVIAQKLPCACPTGYNGKIRGKAETAANVDTDAEILAITQDTVLIDYNSTGATDGGELYTIKDTAAADTSAFQIVDGNPVTGTLDVIVDPRFYRIANDIS